MLFDINLSKKIIFALVWKWKIPKINQKEKMKIYYTFQIDECLYM